LSNKKIYVLDTNVLVESAEALFHFEDNDIVLPFKVIEELDKLKTRQGTVGQEARKTIRYLDELRESGVLTEGVKLNHGAMGTLSVKDYRICCESPDDVIIETTLKLKGKNKNKEVILITNDLSMRLKADIRGLSTSSFIWEGQPKKFEEIYSGAMRIELDSELIDKIYKNKKTKLPKKILEKYDFKPNQFIIGKEGDGPSVISRFKNDYLHLLKVEDKTTVSGLKPRNKEQRFSLDVLLDPDIKLVTLIGRAGSGKTLCAVASALEQIQKRKYKRIIISRPIQTLGKDIGYLPGSLYEKLEPWIQPIKDNLLYLCDGNYREVQDYFDEGIIEIECLSYIRGRSIPNSFLIIDETQNLSATEIKAIITRVGNGSKIVFTGDVEQIDNPYFDPMSNGLTYLIERFKDQDISSHIKLIKGERSSLATLASELL